jgi:hypothetical protein
MAGTPLVRSKLSDHLLVRSKPCAKPSEFRVGLEWIFGILCDRERL